MDFLKRLYKNKFLDIPEQDSLAIKYLNSRGVTTEDIHEIIKTTFNIEYLDIKKEPIDGSLVRNFSKDELKARRLLPIYQSSDTVYFAINALIDRNLRSHAEEFARSFGKSKVSLNKFLLGFEFDELLESLHRGIDIEQFREHVNNNEVAVDNISIDINNQGFDAENVSELILNKGFENRASDIHIEPLEKGFQVRYRVDGQLSIIDPYDTTETQTKSIINVFKLKSGLKIEEYRKGQDGRLRDIKYKGNKFDIRVSSIPSALVGTNGTRFEKIALRILEKTRNIPTMKELGFSKFYINAAQRDILKHHGIILNTGAVGSGKSTTQRTLLKYLDAKKMNIYSIEDPVEMTIPYVNHVCVKETGVDFHQHLETLLRQDPNVIAIGEIRNLATMDMALKASLSGQLVMGTVHTNNALEAFHRLFNMGVEPYELGAAILGVSSQRLVRTLCPYCKTKRKVTSAEKNLIVGLLSRYEKFAEFNMSKFEYIYDADGCDHCNYTGYHGRTVTAEYLSASDEIKSYISTGKVDRDKLLELADSTFVPIEVDALNKVILGKTTISEVIKVV